TPIVRVLFERGAFSAIDAHSTAAMLAALAPGLPAFVLIKVFHPGFFAREDTKTPMIFAAIAMLANVVLSLGLFMAIGGTGIAIAATLSGWINVALLVLELKRRGEFALDSQFRRALLGILLATLCMGIAVFGIERLLEPYLAPSNGIPMQVAALFALVASGLLVYMVSAEPLGAAKWRKLFKDIRA
ncbi:MAG TPA: lipid II flippase MurJ, partial [Methyloceanibacter sp.]|nr:lipid II flippase MurJ [Methyloceanibacter sp.]